MKKKDVELEMMNFCDEANRFLYLLGEYKQFKKSISKKDKKKFKKCAELSDLNFKIQYIANIISEEATGRIK